MNPIFSTTPLRERSPAIDTLRAFLTLLVIAHHAVLAYHPYAPSPSPSFTTPPWLWSAFPVVDSQRWAGIDLLVSFNDAFFMALMFLLSGLFVSSSLQRKGAAGFLRDRALRLGVPFLVAAGILAPIAYYPAYLQSGAEPGITGFAHAWLSLGVWPAGPAWFLWVLLAFASLAALAYRFVPQWFDRPGTFVDNLGQRPLRAWLALIALSVVAYVPLAQSIDPFGWFSVGPFFAQTSRLPNYALYFVIGIAIGAHGLDRGLLAANGRLARRWWAWLLATPIVFLLMIVAFVVTMTKAASGAPIAAWAIATSIAFVASCATSTFAFLALFVRFVQKRTRIRDSLSHNAYGMYLFHYLFVSWLQYALLAAPWSGAAKGSLVFLGAVALSWTTTTLLRRIPRIGKIL